MIFIDLNHLFTTELRYQETGVDQKSIRKFELTMNKSLSFTNIRQDQKVLRNGKTNTQSQQQGKSKFNSTNSGKSNGTSLDVQQPLIQIGFRINEKILGTGSYAKVKSDCSTMNRGTRKYFIYVSRLRKCIRENDNKEFAVKIIDRDRAPSDFVLKFLPRELDIIRGLDHPNIIKVESMNYKQTT